MIALVGKIERRFEPRDQIEQRRVDLASRASTSFELIERRARLQRRHRVDQIRDRFGLHEIDRVPFRYARSVNSPGSASRAPAAIARRDDRFEHHAAAVRRDLDDVFAGVGMRRGKVRGDDLIDRRSASATTCVSVA